MRAVVVTPVRWPSDRRDGTAAEIARLAATLAVTTESVQAAAESGQISLIELPDQVGPGGTWLNVPSWVTTTRGAPIARRLDGRRWQHTGSMTWNLAGDDITFESELCDKT